MPPRFRAVAGRFRAVNARLLALFSVIPRGMGAVFTVVHAVTTRNAVVNRCALPLGYVVMLHALEVIVVVHVTIASFDE